MSIKESMLNNLNDENIVENKNSLEIEKYLNSLFDLQKNNSEEKRIGMHGSAVIKNEDVFCYREQVLSFFFEPNEENISPELKRVFAEGWAIHKKWQDLFELAGIAIANEYKGYSEEYELFFTPDSIIKLKNKKYVVEIKSANDIQFKMFKKAGHHEAGEKQLQLYMYFLGIPQGFVLCENKNTQEIKVFDCAYDYNTVLPFLERMKKVLRYKNKFIESGKIPKRICENANCKRAGFCNYANACFEKRIPLNEKEYAEIKNNWRG